MKQPTKIALIALTLLVVRPLTLSADKPKSKLVYLTEGSTIYHTRDCISIIDRGAKAVDVATLGPEFVACSTCKPLAVAPKGPSVPYVIATPTVARDEPSVTAKIVNRFPALAVVLVEESQRGWARVTPADLKAQDVTAGGWIRADPDYLVPDVIDTVIRRQMLVQGEPWTTQTKADIMRGKIRVGFTLKQVAITLGEPLGRTSTETATGITEAWSYDALTALFRNGKVIEITRTQ
jgi:hypothetical protein